MGRKIETYITKNIHHTLDNLVLQEVIRMVNSTKVKGKLLIFGLNKCGGCTRRQHIEIIDAEDAKIACNKESCIPCEKPVDELILAYRFIKEDVLHQIICLKADGDEMIAMQENRKKQDSK